MDDPSFALTEPLRVLHQAGIRHLLAGPAPVQADRSTGPTGSHADMHPGPADSMPSAGASSAFDPESASLALSLEPWAGHLAKVPPSPLSVWTYAQLGQDLSGNADPARGDLWRRILRTLELPRGSVGFWPSSLPVQDASRPFLDVFVEGIIRISPGSVVFFSDQDPDPAIEALKLAPADVLQSVAVAVFPSPETLLHLSVPELQAHVDRLRLFLSELF